MSKKGFNSVDEYIAACPPQSQERLQTIRETIKKLAPEAKEKISYQIAAFELNGRNLVYFAGWKRHVSLYPIPAGSEAFERQIAPYADGKGTLKFPLDEPLPLKLIEKVVKLHMKANLKRAKSDG
ncbi:MAG: DUF1801 domain-containing protein [Anaerolineales bacterium]|nr:DUF1801 domain-containing protein [Anaerolineales bacterium]NUQ86420.1 DUF1801 domain-containing protein [Anaerolineales bacterium]